MNMDVPLQSVPEVVSEMLRLQRSVPLRPSLDEVEAAQTSILKTDNELASRLEKLFQQARPSSVPTIVYRALQEMREDVLRTEALEQKRATAILIEVEERHRHFDALIQKVHAALQNTHFSGLSLSNDLVGSGNFQPLLAEEIWYSDNDGDASPTSDLLAPRTPERTPSARLISGRISPSSRIHARSASMSSPASSPSHSPAFKPLSTIHEDSSGGQFPVEEDSTGCCSAKFFLAVEAAKRNKVGTLDFQAGSFLNEIRRVPDAIGRVSTLSVLNLSGNQLLNIPDSIGELVRLTELDVSSNKLTSLPVSLGRLSFLRRLSIEKNSIEELPWTIGQCTALVELNADFNQLKALPEAIGQLRLIRRLSFHLNRLKGLPTTVASLSNLEELELHFNHLQSVPESLCSLTTLTRLNLSSNFTDLKILPHNIGNLQSLEHLDISYNHITVLPDSFALLTNLRTLRMDGNPTRLPPSDVVAKGKEAVIEHMINHVAQKETQKVERRKYGLIGKLVSGVTCCIVGSQKEDSDTLGLDILA